MALSSAVLRLPRRSTIAALALFKWSNIYLSLVLLAICLASLGPLWRCNHVHS